MEDIKNTVDVAEAIKDEEQQTDATSQTEDKKEEKPYEFDYDKLAELVSGKLTATKDSVLKGYFKQQGVAPEQVPQYMDTYKEKEAEKTPNIEEIQNNANATMQRALSAEAQVEAMLMASELNVDVKGIPFLINTIKMDEVTENGTVDKAKLKERLEQVVSIFPQLKQTTVQGGFQVVGADMTKSAQNSDDADLERAFGVKK